MPTDREVAGIRCGEVLALLPAFLDGELEDGTRTMVQAHLAGCDWCERFGGSYAGVVQALRRESAAPPAGLADRLRARLGGSGS